MFNRKNINVYIFFLILNTHMYKIHYLIIYINKYINFRDMFLNFLRLRKVSFACFSFSSYACFPAFISVCVNQSLIHSLLTLVIALPNVTKQSGAWLDKDLVEIGKPGAAWVCRVSPSRDTFSTCYV